MFSIQIHGSALHVHAYVDHDHAEHRHGPAMHEHHNDVHQADATPHLNACDPSEHVITTSLTASDPLDARDLTAELALAELPPAGPKRSGCVRLPDVHSHGPPTSSLRLLRGPPR